MRRIRFTEANIIQFLLGVAPVLIALLFSGCTSTEKFREDPNVLYSGYDGPRLPKEEVATIWWNEFRKVLAIDGKTINERSLIQMQYWGAELIPGTHFIEVEVDALRTPSAYMKVHADLEGGRVYWLSAKTRLYPETPVDYAVYVIDEETGAFIAGRPPEVLKWSLSDWEQALQKLKQSSATEKETIELLAEPIYRLPDNTAMYLACRKRGLIWGWEMHVKPPADCGFLFVEFDELHALQDYTFIEVPFRECFRSFFTRWDADAWHREYWDCMSGLEERAFDQFRAKTGRFTK